MIAGSPHFTSAASSRYESTARTIRARSWMRALGSDARAVVCHCAGRLYIKESACPIAFHYLSYYFCSRWTQSPGDYGMLYHLALPSKILAVSLN